MNSSGSTDLIDHVLGLTPPSSTHAARVFRDKVRHGTQASYEALFSPELHLDLGVRWLVAVYATQLTQAQELHQHYVTQAQQANVPSQWLEAVAADQPNAISDPIVQAILIFTRTLTLKPIEGDKAAIQQLEQAGVPTPDCITLSQLIAFLSYQVRLVTGLKAMQRLENRDV